MRTKSLPMVLIGVLSILLFGPMSREVATDGAPPVALRGTVSSPEEGKMEGVVVTARRDGAKCSVSVVSDAQGRYRFPRSHLVPGAYAIRIRAVGYDLTDAKPTVEVAAAKSASLDLRLKKTKDLASQLTSIEWLMSMPGSNDDKDKIVRQSISCVYCHSLERVVKSTYSAEEFLPVLSRMQTYYVEGTAVADDRGRFVKYPGAAGTLEAASKTPTFYGVPKTDLATFLASINLSGGKTTWPYALKTLPRPKGKGTRVILTQYDLPQKESVMHDMTVGPDGTVWYTDVGQPTFGKLDPRAGTFTEYPLPRLSPGLVQGGRDQVVDRDGNLWFALRTESGAGFPTKFDVKTEKLTTIELPDNVAVGFVTLATDGTVLFLEPGSRGLYQVDPQSMKLVRTFKYNNVPPGPHSNYQQVVASNGDPYVTDLSGSYIIGFDAKTGQSTYYPTPTRHAMPRRGQIDAQDRFWFSEYAGDRIGLFDTHAKTFKEWSLPYPYTTPYGVSSPDARGRVWASSNTLERLLRLDPKTGDITEYVVPTGFDTKKILHDPTTNRVVLWMANSRSAGLLKVEPLD